MIPLAVTAKEAAGMLGISESMVWKLLGEDLIEKTKIGRRTLIRVSELERFLSECSGSELRTTRRENEGASPEGETPFATKPFPDEVVSHVQW